MKAGPTREVADEWLHRFPDDATVMAYIGRSGWNDLAFGGAIPDDELLEAVDESYRLVVAKLPEGAASRRLGRLTRHLVCVGRPARPTTVSPTRRATTNAT